MKRLRDWYAMLYDEPERWLMEASCVGMVVCFLSRSFFPFRYEMMLTGAGLLCAFVLFAVFTLGLMGWP